MNAVPVRVNAGLPLLLIAPLLSGCELVGDIFELGVWAGVLMIGLFALLAYAAYRLIRSK